jgi:type IV pilus assembly protein PilX
MKLYSKHVVKRERGFVLAISMIFLIVMTLLAVAAIKKTTVDEKITSNLRSQNQSFQAAEKALRFCERFLDLAAGSLTLCEPKVEIRVVRNADPTGRPQDRWKDLANWQSGGLSQQIPHGTPDAISGLDAENQPRCMIEEWKLNSAGGVSASKFPAWVITARAGPKTDADPDERGDAAVVWLQEVIRCGNM